MHADNEFGKVPQVDALLLCTRWPRIHPRLPDEHAVGV